MSGLESIAKLRKLSKEVVDMRWGVEFDRAIDALEAEVVESYMKHPVDIDGVPVHVGDKLVREADDGIIYTVVKLKFDGRYWWYESGDDCFSCDGARHKPRTLEDVLRDVWKEALDYSKSDMWRNPDEVFAERAAEIREMMKGAS